MFNGVFVRLRHLKPNNVFQEIETDRQRQTDRQTGRQADRQTYRQTGRQADGRTDRLILNKSRYGFLLVNQGDIRNKDFCYAIHNRLILRKIRTHVRDQ